MLGLFSKKLSAEAVGEVIAEQSLMYTEPVLKGLTTLGKLDSRLSESQKLEFGYSLLLNSGSILIPLIIHYLRALSFDHDGFKRGAKSYFDRFQGVYSDKLKISFGYNYWSCIEAAEDEIKLNNNFKDTKALYGSGAQDSVYANLIKFLAEISNPSLFPKFTARSQFDAEDWHCMLECIEGIDRSYRWLTQCFDYKKMEKN